jgi:hypothetical protein
VPACRSPAILQVVVIFWRATSWLPDSTPWYRLDPLFSDNGFRHAKGKDGSGLSWQAQVTQGCQRRVHSCLRGRRVGSMFMFIRWWPRRWGFHMRLPKDNIRWRRGGWGSAGITLPWSSTSTSWAGMSIGAARDDVNVGGVGENHNMLVRCVL